MSKDILQSEVLSSHTVVSMVLLLCVLVTVMTMTTTATRPNIVIIVIDDLGELSSDVITIMSSVMSRME